MAYRKRKISSIDSGTSFSIAEDQENFGLSYGDKEKLEYPEKKDSDAVHAYYRASAERTHFMVLKGELVSRAEVLEIFTRIATDLKKRLEELPERLSTRLAMEGDSHIVYEILRNEIKHITEYVDSKGETIGESRAKLPEIVEDSGSSDSV